ncbi:hypothetical protein VAR608DRAFT_1538 [Variovorax sp. HW608]|nr:hypothetical protein VAR608DRAFT_1538 [Variovorax sp. HW608]
MAWLTQNWVLVLAGVVALIFILRRIGGSHARDEQTASPGGADSQAPGQQTRHGGHGGHGGCC